MGTIGGQRRAIGRSRPGRRRGDVLARRVLAAGVGVLMAGALLAGISGASADTRSASYECTGLGKPGRGPTEVELPVASLTPLSGGSHTTFTATYKISLAPFRSDYPPYDATVDVPPVALGDQRMTQTPAQVTYGTDGTLPLVSSVVNDTGVHAIFGSAPAGRDPVLPTITVSTTIEASYFSHGASTGVTFPLPSFSAGDSHGSNECTPAADETLATVNLSLPLGTVVRTETSVTRSVPSVPGTPSSASTSSTTASTTTTMTRVTRPVPATTANPWCARRAAIPPWLWRVLVAVFRVHC